MIGFLQCLAHPAVTFSLQLVLFKWVSPDLHEPIATASVKSRVLTEEMHDYRTEMIVNWLISFIISITIYLLVMLAYKKNISEKRKPFPKSIAPEYSMADKEWKFSTFDCFSDCTYCLYGCCFSYARLADNVAAVEIWSYWKGGLSWLAMYALSQTLVFLLTLITATQVMNGEITLAYAVQQQRLGNLMYYISNGLFALFITRKTTQMRKSLGDSNADSKFMNDCVCFWCCGCCEIIKHARHIDGASGVRIEGLCQLVEMPAVGVPVQAQVVGQPVEVQDVALVQGAPVAPKH